MTEYICLSCWHLFNSRNEDATSRCCSKCKSRMVIDLQILAKVVSDTKNWMRGNKGLTYETPFQSVRGVPSLKEMLEGCSFEKGLVSLEKVIVLANDWNPKTMAVEDHIILTFRKWAKEKTTDATKNVEYVAPGKKLNG